MIVSSLWRSPKIGCSFSSLFFNWSTSSGNNFPSRFLAISARHNPESSREIWLPDCCHKRTWPGREASHKKPFVRYNPVPNLLQQASCSRCGWNGLGSEKIVASTFSAVESCWIKSSCSAFFDKVNRSGDGTFSNCESINPAWAERAIVVLGWSCFKKRTCVSTDAFGMASTFVSIITLAKAICSVMASAARHNAESRELRDSLISKLPSSKSLWRFNASTVTIKCLNVYLLSWVRALMSGHGRAAPVLSASTEEGGGFSSKTSLSVAFSDWWSSLPACFPWSAATRPPKRPASGDLSSSESNSASTPRSLRSWIIKAALRSASSRRHRRRRVVLPDPRKPQRATIGTFFIYFSLLKEIGRINK